MKSKPLWAAACETWSEDKCHTAATVATEDPPRGVTWFPMPFPLLARLRTDGLHAGMLRAHSGAHLVSVLLAICLAVQAATTTTRVISLLRLKADGHVIVPTRPIQSTVSSVATLANANLFGAPPAPEKPAASESVPSRSPLFLSGTIALTDATQGFAILGKDRMTTHMFRVGSSVAEGVTLREVYADHAVVDRGGQPETVWMPKSSLRMSVTQPLTAAANRAPSITAPAPPQQPMSPEVREHLDYENARVGAVFTETALTEHEQFRGLVVQPGPDPSMLAQMGLKPGDVVLGVDSINIDLNNVNLLRKSLASGHKIVLNIMRPQQGPIDLQLDSSAYQGLVSN